MRRLLYLTIAIATPLLIWLTQGECGAFPGQARTGEPTEIRGVWLTNVDSEVLFSTAAVQTSLQRLSDLNFNTIYPVVWSWGYTLYPSEVCARATGYKQGLYPDLTETGRNEALEAAQGDRDMLLEVVHTAHHLGLSVIPWFEFGFMAPANSPLAQRHPQWLTQKQGALPAARLQPEGAHTRVWLNPFHPEVQQFLLDLIAELMANYPVEGLQLDDHWSLPVEFGYDPYTIALYQREHRGKSPPANPNDPEWMRWRAHKITQFLDRVFRVVKARRPHAVLSVSPNPAEFAYRRHLQDWPRWREIGYIEELIVQVYRQNMAEFRHDLRDRTIQQARTHIPTGVGILSGLRTRPVPMSQIQEQVKIARELHLAGVSFFFYETLWQTAPGETERDRVAGLQQLFPTPQARTTL